MTTTITPSGHPVHLHPVHALTMRPEDVAEQQELAALALAGREDEVFRRLDAARAACVGRIEARRVVRSWETTAPRRGDTEARPEERCETMIRGKARLCTSMCE